MALEGRTLMRTSKEVEEGKMENWLGGGKEDGRRVVERRPWHEREGEYNVWVETNGGRRTRAERERWQEIREADDFYFPLREGVGKKRGKG